MEDAPPPTDLGESTGADGPADAPPRDEQNDRYDRDGRDDRDEWRILRFFTGLLPWFFYQYERLCKWIASDGVHNLGFFASTFFCGPAGLYVWESRKGGFFRRLFRGLVAWILLVFGIVLLVSVGWTLALMTLVPGRPFRWIVRKLKVARARPAPEVPRKLTFEIRSLDVASLVFISIIFLVFVANRDQIARLDMVSDSDPIYHMAVAKQILDHKGGLPVWDRWEFAPLGRPHLYHPALHYLIAFFSWKTGDVLHGFNTVQMLQYPLALLAGWYFARWMFGAAGGFLALIFLSMDMAFLISQAMAMPAGLVTALVPLILLFFLARRTIPTVILLTIALYTHGPVGVPEFVVLGLFVFSVRYREYFPFFRKVIAFAGLFLVPWLAARTLKYGEWFGTSSGAMGAKNVVEIVKLGVVQLQIISPILFFLAFRGSVPERLRRRCLIIIPILLVLALLISPILLVLAFLFWWRDEDAQLGVVKSLLVGFLPMLLVYGGRYFMHTSPLWAILIARNFEKWLGRHEEAAEGGQAVSVDRQVRARKSMRRRVFAFIALAFVPLPVIITGMKRGEGPHVMPGITGLNATFGVAVMKIPPDTEFDNMAEFIRLTMPPRPGIEIKGADPHEEPLSGRPPDEEKRWRQEREGWVLSYEQYYAALKRRIVHVGRAPYGSPYLANRLTVATGLRADYGGWAAEVRSPLMKKELERAREEDPECLFVFRKQGEDFTLEEEEKLKGRHRLEWTRAFGGKYLVGGRGVGQAAGVLEPPEDDEVF